MSRQVKSKVKKNYEMCYITHPVEIKDPHMNIDMLPSQLLCGLYGSL